MDDLSEFYLKEKPVKTVVSIHRSSDATFCREVSTEIDSTYAHTVKMVSRLREMSVVNTEEEGRKKMLTLTDIGEKQAELFIEFMELNTDESLKRAGKLRDNPLQGKK